MLRKAINTRKKQQRHLFKNGFTFIEIIVVVIILLTLVIVSTPRFVRSYRLLTFNNLTKDILDLSRTLQQISSLQGKKIKMILDTETNKITILSSQDEDNDTVWLALKDPLFKPIKIPKKCQVSFSPKELYFYPETRISKAEILITYNEKRKSKIIFDNHKGTIYLRES